MLAGLCKYGQSAWSDIVDICDNNSFTDPDNQIILTCVKTVLEQTDSVDIPSILSVGTSLGFTDSLSSKEQREYIRSLFNFPIEQENVRKQAQVLKKLYIARKAQELAKSVYNSLSSVTGNEPINDILAKIETPLIDFGSDIDGEENEKTCLIMDGIEEFLQSLEDNEGGLMGIPSPFSRYNEYIGGGRRRGGVYLVGARPKAGKSTMALNDALHVAGELRIPVLYLDTEMSKDGQLPRLLANISNTKIKDIEMAEFKDNAFMKTKILENIEKYRDMPFSYRTISGKEFSEILSIVRRWITKDVGLDEETGRTKDCLIIYDYFKLMSTDALENLQEFQALGFQISALADFLKKYDVTCQSYVQLNRDGISKETSDIISQSDRLLWLCSSFAILKQKTAEEIQTDGVENGNTKLIPTSDQRFGPGMPEGDYINMYVERDKAIMIEGKTKSELKINNSEGFNVIDEAYSETMSISNDDTLSDDDFDKVNYGDSQYRKDSRLWQGKRADS